MIHDVMDVAAAIAYGLAQAVRQEADQVMLGDVRRASFAQVHPETAVFTVATIEGKRFRVAVTQEAP